MMQRVLSSVTALVTFALVGCTTVVETDSTIEVRNDGSMRIKSDSRSGMTNQFTDAIIPPSIDREYPEKIKSLRSLNALLVGISNFDSGVLPSPQHAIGASILESILRRIASNSSGTHLSLNFIADLRMDVENPGWGTEEVTRYLKRIGQDRVYEYSTIFDRTQGELWPVIQGENITKHLLMESMQKHAKSIQTGEFGILYLATHGILGKDNIRYALSADSDKSRPETMLSYDEAISIYRKELGSEGLARVLLIFDTCLAKEDDVIPEETPRLKLSPAVLVLSAAAPGQYAYYWSHKAGLTLVDSTVRIGPLQRKLSARDLTYFRTISAVPVAFARALKSVERACEINQQVAPPEITAREFGELLARVVEQIVQESSAKDLPKTQNTQYFESDALRTIDSYYEMSMSDSQIKALRRRSAIFSTGCAGE
jgi:hypothetical protein